MKYEPRAAVGNQSHLLTCVFSQQQKTDKLYENLYVGILKKCVSSQKYSIIDAFRCHFQEEHYATFRAELEAIIHAQDVEDGNLTGRKHSRCCGQGYWDETNDCEDIVIKTFGFLYSMRCMHTWILIYIKIYSIQQLFQPVQLHATDYTWFMITPHINQQVFNLKKQMHPHLDAVNCFIQPSFS